MITRCLVVLMMLLAICYSTAPSWVASGVNLNYSVGTDTVSFSVLDRSGDDIHINQKTISTSAQANYLDNASAESGHFWFDSSEFSGESVGNMVGDYDVIAQGSQHFAGKDWDTITLQGTISGATTTFVYDTATGLLLKETVSAAGAPTVTLVSYYVPAWAPPPPPPAPVNNTNATPPHQNASMNNTGSPPPANTSGSSPPPQQPSQPPGTNISNQGAGTPPGTQPATSSGAAKKKLCSSSAFILLILGLAIIRIRR